MTFLRITGFLLLFSLLTGSIFGQTANLRVYTKDKSDGETVPFVSLKIVETNETGATDDNGIKIFSKLKPGTYHILAVSTDYDNLTLEVTLKANESKILEFMLEPKSSTIGEVEIIGEKLDEKTNVKISVESVTPKQINRVPSPGGEPDIANYMATIPGVISTGDQGGQLYVRGGAPIQNKVLLDGMVIYNPFHSIGFYSVFDTDIIKNADIYTGGYNAEYGGRISSVMDITTRDGNKKEFAGKLSASPFGAKVLAEGPITKVRPDKGAAGSFLLSAKTSYMEQASKIFYTYVNGENGLPFNFTDIYGKVSFNSGSGSKFNLFGFNYNDRVTYQSISELSWDSYGGGTNFVMLLPGTPILTEGHFAYSKYSITLDDKTSAERRSSVAGFNGGFDFKYFMKRDEIRYGIEVNGFATDFLTYNSVNREIRQTENTTELAGYVAYKLLTGRIIFEPGFRAHYYASLRNFSPEPRLGFKFNATDILRFKLAGGMYSQNLISANSDRDVVNLFYGFLSGSDNLPSTFTDEAGNEKEVTHSLQKANHAIAGMEVDVTKKISINLEGYYKVFTQLTNMNRNKIYEDDGNEAIPDIFKKDFIIETGDAKGVDLSVKYTAKKTYIFAAYSLGKVTRWDGISTYAPVWDRRHNVNVMGTQTAGKKDEWEFNIRWNFGSGLPFTQTAGIFGKPFSSSISGDPLANNPDELSYIYGTVGGGRLPTYHRLDISIKRIFEITKSIKSETEEKPKSKVISRIEVNAGVTNLYNRDNIFYVERSTQETIYQLPILPSIGFNWEF